jgi:uncharacterized cupredoxin-like copper-binding protein
MRRFLFAMIAAGLGIAAAEALAAAAEGSPPARPVTVVTSEYKFSPAKLAFKRGVRYRLHLENRGKEEHEFTAPEFFKTVKLQNAEALNADRTEIELPPGSTKDLFFTPQQAGHYPLRCSDHDWAGMTGSITVR